MKVTIIQPNVPHYRVPLFDALADQPGVNLSVVSASVGHGTQYSGHMSGMPYLDDNHSWRKLLPGGALLWQRGLSQVHLGEAGDVLIICGNLRYVSNYPLMLRARHSGMGIVWWSHGRTRCPKPVVEQLRLAVLKFVDAVLLYTDDEVQLYKSMGLPPAKLFATNNTVDEASIHRATDRWNSKQLEQFCTQKSLDQKALLLFCGRLKTAARLDLALRAMKLLHNRGLNCQLVVIGDGPERQRLEYLASELGLSQSMRWMGALYDQVDLAPWFLSARALVYPGPIGLSLMHALNYGLPVITHNNHANHKPEIAAFEHGVNGLQFTEGDVEDLAAKVAAILSAPSLRDRLSTGALRTIREHYGLARMVDGFIKAVQYASARAIERCSTRSSF